MYDELIRRLRVNGELFQKYIPNAEGEILLQAADAIEELNKLLKGVHDAHNEGYDVGYWAGRRDYEPKWIPATERLPEANTEVLIYLWDRPAPYIAWVDTEGRWKTNDFYVGIEYTPKAWMPLPKPYEPPKEET